MKPPMVYRSRSILIARYCVTAGVLQCVEDEMRPLPT